MGEIAPDTTDETILLGVDGGGSKTHAVVATVNGELLGAGVAGGSNWEEQGVEAAGVQLHASVEAALDESNVGREAVGSAVFGLSGVDWPSDVPRLQPLVERFGLAGDRQIVNDAFVALAAGTSGSSAVVVIAGSGCTTAGRNAAGNVFRTLGHGPPLFDDYGSAPDVAARAVWAVSRAYTGRGPKTRLTERLCAMTGRRSAAELLEGLTRREISVPAAAPVVIEEAERGDAVAREIVVEAGRALGESAALVIRTLAMEGDELDVVLAGGLFRSSSSLLLDSVAEPIDATAKHAHVVALTAPPVVGAVRLAAERAGRPIEGHAWARLVRGSCEAFR